MEGKNSNGSNVYLAILTTAFQIIFYAKPNVRLLFDNFGKNQLKGFSN